MRLLERGDEVVGFDNLNDYYDVALKEARLARFATHPRYTHVLADLADRDAVASCFAEHQPRRVVHLAAQAGVRYAAKNPHVYVSSNVTGTLHVLEGCRHHDIEHLVFASTSSVYGSNAKMPFSERDHAEHPLTLYAATKKANEMMAHSYAHLFGIPCTGLRFFTVYGPWGRPDMALFLFTRAMLEGREIEIFNHGQLIRDFTYVDDIVEGVIRVLDKAATPDATFDPMVPSPATSTAPYRIFNIGNGQPVPLMEYVAAIEDCLGITAKKKFLPMQPGDVMATSSDTSALAQWVGFRPGTSVRDGVARFVDWYKSFYSVNTVQGGS
jgi:UDP-glucuronate 4-epimerase